MDQPRMSRSTSDLLPSACTTWTSVLGTEERRVWWRQLSFSCCSVIFLLGGHTEKLAIHIKQADRQTDRQTDRQAGRQAGRQTDRQTDSQVPVVISNPASHLVMQQLSDVSFVHQGQTSSCHLQAEHQHSQHKVLDNKTLYISAQSNE